MSCARHRSRSSFGAHDTPYLATGVEAEGPQPLELYPALPAYRTSEPIKLPYRDGEFDAVVGAVRACARHDGCIDARVRSGEYGNTSEYIRELIRRDQQEQAKKRLRELIQEGLESGPSREFTPKVAAELRKRALGGRH